MGDRAREYFAARAVGPCRPCRDRHRRGPSAKGDSPGNVVRALDCNGVHAQNRDLVAAMAIAGIDAIHDGEIKRIERPAPTGRDFDALEKALRAKGLDTPEIEALLDGKAGDPPIGDAKKCLAGQVYLESLAAMPESTRLRIYSLAVELMARS
jgi:hypothetical protein